MITRPRPVDTPDDRAFWEYVDSGELRLQRCQKCGRFRYPPSPCCPTCLSECAQWDQAAGKGTLLTWVTMRRQYFPTLAAPYIVGVIELDEEVLMCGNLPFESLSDLRAGREVEAVLEPSQFDDGTAFICPQWRLRRGGS